MFKKIFIIALATMVIFTSAPRRTEAAVGSVLLSGGATAVVFGYIFLVYGGILFVSGAISTAKNNGDHEDRKWGLIGLILGAIVLDQETGNLAFKEMNPELASELNVTAIEREAYNQELVHLNLITESMIAETHAGHFKNITEIAEGWKQYANAVSPEASSAFQKLMLQISKQL